MINVNIPNLTTASLQPDFTKYAAFPGFIFYHTLKEWVYFNGETTRVEPDYLLDELNLPGSFSFLVGNNNSNIFIAQPEEAQLLKLQVNPNTGDTIAKTIIDIKTIVQTDIGEARSVGIMSGYVIGNYIILGCAVTEGTTPALRAHKPYVLFSNDNGGTFSVIVIPTTPFINDYLTPTGIARINFYNIYYYVFWLDGYNTASYYLYVVSEEELFNNQTAPEYLQTYTTFGVNNFGPEQKHINRQFVWNYNKLYALSEDRRTLVNFNTGLHKSSTSYPTQYPILPFGAGVQTSPGNIFTQIQQVDNQNLQFGSKAYVKQETLSNGVSPGFVQYFYDYYQLWDEVQLAQHTNKAVIDFAARTDEEFYYLILTDVAGVFTPSLERHNFSGAQAIINLREISIQRFNTGGIYWTGEVVDHTVIPTWNQDVSVAQWLSHDEDTNIIDYGGVDFDYILTLNIDLPIAATITADVYVDNEVTDVLVDGVPQGVTASGFFTPTQIALTLPKGPSTLTFQIRNTASPNPNPTGIKVEWNAIQLPSIPAAHSDIFIDEDNDRLYISLEPYAWVLELSTLTKIATIDLLAEELPGGPFLIPSGVDQTAGKPIKWKWIKEFNSVYIYNEYHDTTYTTVDDKFFYTWRIDPLDPSYHEMYSAFDLPVETCTHIHYFFDLSNELHGILSSRTSPVVSNSNFRSIQYRIAGLANFAQVTSDPVTAGPFVTQDVFVANNGKVYLSKSNEPTGYTDPNTALFVYVNNNGGDLSAGSYTIAIDGIGGAFNYNTFEQFTPQPTGYTAQSLTNFDKIGKLVWVPGDYDGYAIINSTAFRNHEFDTHIVQFGNTTFNQQRIVFNNTDEDFVIGKVGQTQRWTYFVLYNNVNSNYRLLRTRTVFYSTT